MVIVAADQGLAEWVTAVVGDDATLSTAPPDQVPAGGVGLYLMSLVPSPELVNTRIPQPYRFALRYLITAPPHDDAAAGHRLVERLLAAALERRDLQVDLEPLPAEAWLAFGAPPQPSFVVQVDVQLDRPEPAASLVLHPLDFSVSTSRAVEGQVVGPGGVPLAGARVELIGLNQGVDADSRGRFRFGAVPAAEGASIRFKILVKGREFTARAELAPGREPVVIRCNLLEE